MNHRIVELLKLNKDHLAIQLYKSKEGVTFREALAAIAKIKNELVLVKGNHRSDSAFSPFKANTYLHQMEQGLGKEVIDELIDRYGILPAEATFIVNRLLGGVILIPTFDFHNLKGIIGLIEKNQKMAAVKLYWQQYDVRLKEAKERIDEIEAIFLPSNQ